METTNTAHGKMNAAIEAADREASKAKKAAVSNVATKMCSRCGGKGSDYFFGGSRAPGVCFKCGGSGKVLVPGKAKKAATALQAQIELDRLRACWKAVRDALTEEKALPSTWATRASVSELERHLALYEKAGKELAAEISGKVSV
jgi:hypothetical protein